MRRDIIQPTIARESGSIIPVLILIFITFSFFIYFSIVPGGNSSLITSIMFCVVAIVLAFTDSRYLMPYILYVWMAAPGVRRILDYLQENFQAISPLVVASLAATLSALIPILRRRVKLDARIIRALGLIILALIYASILGLFRNGTPAIYDIANFSIPILVLIYLSIQRLDVEGRDSLIRSYVTMTVLLAIYGWIQFLFVPVWDAYWLHHSHMTTIGVARPLMMRVFSTLNAPSSAGALFGVALIPMLAVPKWRGVFGWFGVIAVAGALAFTLVRAAWIILFVGIFTFILCGNGKQRWVSAFRLATALAVAALLFPLIPGLKSISHRAETLTNLSEDRSTQVRILGTFLSLQSFLKEPYGRGLGSLGESSKLSSDTSDSSMSKFNDNGIVVLMNTFGLLGSAALFIGLWTLYRSLRHANSSQPKYRDYTRLGLAVFMCYMFSLPFGNSLQGVTAISFWFFVGIALAKPPEIKQIMEPDSAPATPMLTRGRRI